AGLAAEAAGIEALAARTGGGGPGILTGTAWAEGNALRQGVVLLGEGRVLTRRARHLFHPAEPGAGVFTPGPAPGPMVFRSCRLGVMSGAEATDPAIAETLAETGAELLLHLSGAPYLREAEDAAVDAAVPRVVETGLPMLGVSPLGAWGARIWAGGAFALGADRRLLARLPRFAGTPLVTEWEEAGDGWASPPLPLPPPAAPLEELWQALVLALRAALRESRRPRAEAAPDQPLLAAL
ncbi:NH(3)-dependent NAD+ synthetase family protein, partial [Pseudoroseomonas cervicalis ATCC 49957]